MLILLKLNKESPEGNYSEVKKFFTAKIAKDYFSSLVVIAR